MAGIVPFKHGRMYVGWRRRDWLLVSYEPLIEDVDADPDGLAPSLYFTATGTEEERPPMEGEVMFFPHFALETCESKTKKERVRMQIQFLTRAFAYLNYSGENLGEYEKTLEEPKWRKWQSWFDEAKKWKRKGMKAKLSRRKLKADRVRAMQAAGVPEDEIDRDIDSDDSGVEVGSNEVHMRSRTGRTRHPMNPPPRRSNGNGNNNKSNLKKRKRQDAYRSPTRYDSDDVMMSGANDNARARLSRSGSFVGILNGADRAGSLEYDLDPPEQSLDRNSNSHSGLFMTPNDTPAETHAERRDRYERLGGGNNQATVEDEDDFINAASFNGVLTEAEAFDQALRASQQPEDRSRENILSHEEHEDESVLERREREDIDQAIRASQQPEDRIKESTEDQNGVARGSRDGSR